MKRVARFDFQGRLDGITRTPQGGIRATANLTRTGIFHYGTEDQPFDELRPKDEVFVKASLVTLDTAPLTIGHPTEVNADNWKELSVGHVIAGTVKANGRFVTADVAIQDAETCTLVESGDLCELSCGYEVDLDMTPGEHDGQHYDAVQRNIRYNHVALGGTDWGRAGRDVRLYLDSERCICGAPSLDAMNGTVKRTDAPSGTPTSRQDAPSADSDGLRRDLDASRTDNDRLRAERDAAVARADKLQAKLDAAEKEKEDKEKEDEDEEEEEKKKKAEDAKTFHERVDARVQLVADAKTILGSSFDYKGKNDREVRVAALKKLDPKFDEKDRSDGYVEARFDLEVPKAKKDQAALAEVNVSTVVSMPTETEQAHADGGAEPLHVKAQREMRERNQNAWKTK